MVEHSCVGKYSYVETTLKESSVNETLCYDIVSHIQSAMKGEKNV